MKLSVESECESCDGTGLYCGMAEPKGTAVVCLSCNGTGCRTIHYTPFSRRKEKRGVHTVSLSRGSFILNCGPGGKPVSYEEFQSGKMPKP